MQIPKAASHNPPQRPTSNTPEIKAALLAAALDGLRRNLSIIAIRAGGKKPLAGKGWKRWQSERPEEKQVREWLSDPNVGGIAVILGEVSGGIICRDFDSMPAYQAWAKAHPDLAATLPTVATARGRHVYAKTAGPTATRKIGDGEIRGEGAYTLWPPSLHPSGCTYRWIIPLPTGDLPTIDLADSGFLECWLATETTEADRSKPKPLKGEGAGGSVNSVGSVCSVAGGVWESVDAAIGGTMPERVGERNRRIFDFARMLKAIPALTDAPLAELKPIMREWHGRALPFIGTKPFEESWLDFCHAWNRVKFPAGSEPMAMIAAKARASPPPACAMQFEQSELRLLAALCRELQRSAGDSPFYLGCRAGGRYVGVDQSTASRWLKLLGYERIWEVVSKGDTKTMKASRYRYLGDGIEAHAQKVRTE